MPISISKDSLYMKDPKTGEFIPVSMYNSGANETLEKIAEIAESKKTEASSAMEAKKNELVEGLQSNADEIKAQIVASAEIDIEEKKNRVLEQIPDSYTELQDSVNQLKDDLTNKLPKSPANWEAWTVEEQAAAREMIKAGSAWGMDLPLLKTITLEEAVSSIDILSSEEGITLQEFSVFLFATAAGDDGVAFSGKLCLLSNGGSQYWGYSNGYINKTVNTYKIWHTKIYDNKFAVTDIIAGFSGSGSVIAYEGFQGLYEASNEQYSCVTSINRAYPINNLNLILVRASTSGAVIPRGSMIFLFGR